MRLLSLACAASLVVFGVGARRLAADDMPPPAKAPAEPESKYIDWVPNFAEVFEKAKKEGKPVFIAVNAERVDGGKREPAGKELREHTYLDPAVVAKSKKFVCAMLKPEGTSADYAEVRKRFAIDGLIVSPQHIFGYSDGTLIQRHEYWPHGTGKTSVDALLDLMDRALTAETIHKGSPPPPPPTGAPPAGGATPPGPDAGAPAPAPGAPAPAIPGAAPSAGTPEAQRAEWIRGTLEHVKKGSAVAAERDEAIRQLVAQDQKGDCIEPLCFAMVELKKDPPSQVAILRALGKPNLLIAAPSIGGLLGASDEDVRANAAVTLEYIGDPRSVEALAKRLPVEHEERVWCDVVRALGRCGAKQEAARKTLLREIASGKSLGEVVALSSGLAYFEKDAEAARGLEKVAAKDADKRGPMLWALTEIGDPKSSDFVKREIVPKEKSVWRVPFINAIVAKLDGSSSDATEGAISYSMGWVIGQTKIPQDAARRQRDQSEFKPKGEFEGRGRGGPGGVPGGGGPPGMGG